MKTTLYRSRPTKSQNRRSGAEIAQIRASIRQVLEDDNPMTVRQVFYRLVSAGVIAKTEAEYKQTVIRLLTEMRRAREIPFGWIADNTRWMRKPTTFDSLEDALQSTARTYRRALWQEQPVYVEIWLEKDALAGVLYDVTQQWDVPLMVTRGYPSLTYLHEAAESIAYYDKPAHIYYFGDHDPSGLDIPRKVEAGLREFAPDAEISFERVAVTPEQIERWQLPTRPTKKTDSRSKSFEGESVEVDAISSQDLRTLVRRCIDRHVDQEVLRRVQLIEKSEQATLLTYARLITSDGIAEQAI